MTSNQTFNSGLHGFFMRCILSSVIDVRPQEHEVNPTELREQEERARGIYEHFMVSLFLLYGASDAMESKDKERNGYQFQTSNRSDCEKHDNSEK